MFEACLTLIIATSFLIGSPGPAPLVLAATSASFGIRATLPFLTGILLGLLVVILGTILGVALILESYPKAKVFVQVIGAAYLLYVAFKIANAPVANKNNSENVGLPTMLDGFILNLLNPKAYAAFFAIFSQFLIPFDSVITSYTVTALISFSIAVIVDFIWVLLGRSLRNVFESEKSAKAIRLVFALIIVFLVVLSFIY